MQVISQREQETLPTETTGNTPGSRTQRNWQDRVWLIPHPPGPLEGNEIYGRKACLPATWRRAAAATQRMGVKALNKQRKAMARREGERSYLLAFAFSIL